MKKSPTMNKFPGIKSNNHHQPPKVWNFSICPFLNLTLHCRWIKKALNFIIQSLSSRTERIDCIILFARNKVVYNHPKQKRQLLWLCVIVIVLNAPPSFMITHLHSIPYERYCPTVTNSTNFANSPSRSAVPNCCSVDVALCVPLVSGSATRESWWTIRDDSDWITAHVPHLWSIDDTPNWWLNGWMDQFSEWEDQGQEAPDYDGKFSFPLPIYC